MILHSVRNCCCIAVAFISIITAILYSLFYMRDIACITNVNSTYTYIIVGAGTSGCVLAARLSEETNNTVLLIEAGSHYNIFAKYPLFATMLQKSIHDWSYETIPQRWSSKGFFQQKQALPRGKGLGGSGLMNFMVHDIDFDSFDKLRNYMQLDKFEDIGKLYQNNTDAVQSYYLDLFFHSSKQATSDDKSEYPATYLQLSNSTLSEILKESVRELNSSLLEYQSSFSSIHNGERWATYHSHLIPASRRPNLHILCNHEVIKILFEDGRADGVIALDSNGNSKKIYSDKEIILSAGAINSPKLLLLSGIGNKSVLDQLKIPVTADVPGVGLNLHDHFQVPLYVSIKQPFSVTLSKLLQFKEIYNYLFHRTGLLSSSPIAGTVRSKPNVNLILFSIGSTDEDIFRAIGNYLSTTFRSIFPFHKNTSQEGFVFLAGCGKPKSRGYVKLINSEPRSDPLINPKYLQNREDRKCIAKAVRLAAILIKTNSFKKIGATLHWPQFRQCRRHSKLRWKVFYIKCIIQVAAISTYHQAGTCKMGSMQDILSVVDDKFMVKGVSGLRTVDASILPNPTYAFLNSMVIGLAELAAIIIKL